MARSISCSNCGATIEVQETGTGQMVYCHTCGTKLEVPPSSAAAGLPPHPSNPGQVPPQMSQMKPYDLILKKMTRDMRFMGMINIISGGVNCLTIIGAIWGIPQIIAGIRLRESAQAYSAYGHFSDPSYLVQAFERQQRHFYILKILTIVGIVLTVLYLIVMLILLSLGVMSGLS